MGGLVQFIDGAPVFYPYTPSAAAAWAYVVLFAVATIAHMTLMWKFRAWYFTPLVLGGICEIFGHYGRVWSHSDPQHPGPFMLQLMLILLAPVFVSATVYVALGHLRRTLLAADRQEAHEKKERQLLKRRRRRQQRGCCSCCCTGCCAGCCRSCCTSVTSLFVLTDAVAFCTQVGGSLVQITGDAHIMEIGETVVLAGLCFQLLVLAVFLGLVVRFYRAAAREVGGPAAVVSWRRYVAVLGSCVVIIWVRNLVRVIEFAQGFFGFVAQTEAMLYVFDSSLMLLVMVLLAVWGPPRLARQVGIDDDHSGARRQKVDSVDERGFATAEMDLLRRA